MRRVRFAERRDDAVAAPLGRPQVHEQHLVLVVVDDRRQLRPAPRQVRGRQLALEDGELQMVAVPAHGLKDFAQALVVADVVADQVGGAHASENRLRRAEIAILALCKPIGSEDLGDAAAGHRGSVGFLNLVRGNQSGDRTEVEGINPDRPRDPILVEARSSKSLYARNRRKKRKSLDC